MVFKKISDYFSFIKKQLSRNSCETLFWLINIFPTIGGYSLYGNKIRVPFWVLHLTLLFYVYIWGTITYYMHYAKEASDFVNSFFNISIFGLTVNSIYWTFFKRSSLQDVLKLVKTNDDFVQGSKRFSKAHEAILRTIKNILLSCYTLHFINDVCIFSTARVIGNNDIIIASCNGLNPLSGGLNIVICKTLLTIQELTAVIVVGTYDIMFLFLITHTTGMCNILKLEISDLSKVIESSSLEDNSTLQDRFRNIIDRHAKLLQTVRMLQSIYSIPIGVDFTNHAVSLMVFFMLPFDDSMKFGPLVSHNLLVFFLYCLLGQRLTTAAEKMEMAIYCCGWENFTRTKDRKAVLTILKQMQKPVILLAAGVVPIRIYTFANTMQMIYKFVTVFKV